MELWCIKKIVVIVGLLVTSCYGARPLNILFVTGHFPSRSQTFIKNEIKGMIDRGHNVGIFSISDSDGTEFTKEDKEVYQLHIRTFYRIFPYYFLPCDVVVCEFGYNASRIIDSEITRGWLRGKKLTATFRGSDLSAHYKKNPHRYDQLFERCDFFFAVCESFKNRLIEIGCNPDKIVVHHSAIDCLLFSSKNKHVVQKKDAKVHF